MNDSRKNRLTIGFLILCALILAVAPSLMVWKWHIMSLGDPSAVIGLVAAWVAALVILGVCVWYHHQTHAKAVAAQLSVGAPAPEQ